MGIFLTIVAVLLIFSKTSIHNEKKFNKERQYEKTKSLYKNFTDKIEFNNYLFLIYKENERLVIIPPLNRDSPIINLQFKDILGLEINQTKQNTIIGFEPQKGQIIVKPSEFKIERMGTLLNEKSNIYILIKVLNHRNSEIELPIIQTKECNIFKNITFSELENLSDWFEFILDCNAKHKAKEIEYDNISNAILKGIIDNRLLTLSDTNDVVSYADNLISENKMHLKENEENSNVFSELCKIKEDLIIKLSKTHKSKRMAVLSCSNETTLKQELCTNCLVPIELIEREVKFLSYDFLHSLNIEEGLRKFQNTIKQDIKYDNTTKKYYGYLTYENDSKTTTVDSRQEDVINKKLEKQKKEITDEWLLNKVNEHSEYHKRRKEEAEKLLDKSLMTCFDLELELLRNENLKYYSNVEDLYKPELCNLEQQIKALNKESIEFYFSRVLQTSIYPNFVTKNFQIDYNAETQILLVNYVLPNIQTVPNIKEVVLYTSGRHSEEPFKPAELNALYDNILHQIVLRTNYEIFTADKFNVLNSCVFNGWVNYTDKADGVDKTACILSMQADKEEFLKVNLSKVEPKECFKKFKGFGSSALHSITPINPILNLDKNDTRFTTSYEVMNQLNEEINLAAMDWQDFENLIREIFEKEFSQNGGEVKVTQASRDGGVDAIAFDPDPIRGGKIVIQAKRYTNIVGVSAVRDLYGTVMNEGATKGILITTSDFGSDSHQFANGKPLTLLNGSNLLYLLEKHGYQARINIAEAKQMFAKEK